MNTQRTEHEPYEQDNRWRYRQVIPLKAPREPFSWQPLALPATLLIVFVALVIWRYGL